MRVAMVSPEFLSWGGVGSYMKQLADHLSPEHEVHVICLGKEGGAPQVENITLHVLGTAEDTFMYNNQFQVALWRSFDKLKKEHEFDIMHGNHAQMADIMFKVLGEKVPSVTTVHSTIGSQRMGTRSSGLPANKLEMSEKMTLLLLPLLTTLEKVYMKRSSSLIYVSDFIRDWCQDRIGATCASEVIHNGIDTDLFSPRDRDECLAHFPDLEGAEDIVLFSGRMIALKGIATAIEAASLVDPSVSPTFVFAGNGNAEQWKAMAAKAGLSKDECRFIGPVSYREMPYLYPLASLFMLPSYSESFPMTLLEAMASGTPVVASKVGGVPEMIVDGTTGILVPPKDAAALARSIETVLADRDLARKMSTDARTRVLEEFSAAVMARRTADVYKRTVEAWT